MAGAPTARDASTKYFVTLSPETDLLEAIALLVKRNVSGAPVADEQGQLVGVLTEKDCLRLLANWAWGELYGGEVRDYMSRVRSEIRVDMDVFEAAERFLETNFPVLPLLDAEDKLVGRITRQDLLEKILKLEQSLDDR